MEYWTLRRHLRELADPLGKHPLLLRAIDLVGGGIGLVLRCPAGQRCLSLFSDGEEQGLFITETWTETENESPLVRRLNSTCRDARLGTPSILGFDRVARLPLLVRDPFFQETSRFTLIGEFTGRVGCLLLLDADEIVLEQSKATANNRQKSPYAVPGSPSGTIDPLQASPVDWGPILAAPASTWSDRVLGLSPLLKRELIWRLQHATDSEDRGTIAGEIFLEASREETPVFMHLDNGKLLALSPVELQHLEDRGEVKEFTTVGEALQWLESGLRRPRRLAGLRERVTGWYRRELEKRTALADEQRRRLTEFGQAETLKHLGELLLANLRLVQPRASEITLEDWDSSQPITVVLDPEKSPADNAQRYFQRYKKAKRGYLEAEKRLRELEAETAWLREQLWFGETAERESDLEALLVRSKRRRDLVQEAIDRGLTGSPGTFHAKQARSSAQRLGGKSGGRSAAKKKGDQASPQRELRQAKRIDPIAELDGCRFYIGRNGRQNDLVTFGLGRRGDLWAHAQDVPGAHVIAKRSSGPITPTDTHRAAVLAAWFSFARDAGKTPVDVTDVAHVKRIPGGGPGRVSFTHQRTLIVSPAEAPELIETRSPAPGSGDPADELS